MNKVGDIYFYRIEPPFQDLINEFDPLRGLICKLFYSED